MRSKRLSALEKSLFIASLALAAPVAMGGSRAIFPLMSAGKSLKRYCKYELQ
jgi:hypothetical protein